MVLWSSSSPSAMFLLIPPDAVAGSLAWSGVAADSNLYSEFYNPAQTAFQKGDFDFTVGYYPWLRALVNDINYTNTSLKFKTSPRNNINISYIYMSYGDFYISPNAARLKRIESAIGLSDSYLISKSSSLGLKAKYIQSNILINSFDTLNSKLRKFHSLAFGLSYYHTHRCTLFRKTTTLNFGASLDNVGSKIGNDSLGLQAFIPAVLRVGQSLKINLSNKHELTLQYDVYKLLTPSSPVYQMDSTGRLTGEIISGENPDMPVFTAMVNSFSDAPGGLKEEIQEIQYCGGIEYGYNNQFFVRAGYSHQSPTVGNSQFCTVGGAFRYSSFELAIAYLIPIEQRNPFENTLSFSLRVH